MDNFERLTDEENVIMSIFTKLLKETNHLSRNVIIFPSNIQEGKMIIDKSDYKWIFYIYERGKVFGYKEYDNLYSLCIDVFKSLDKDSTDYCMDVFVPLVEDLMNNEFNQKKMIKLN